MRCISAILSLVAVASALSADGPKDNLPDNVRRVPPPGIKVPDEELKQLQASLDHFRGTLDRLKALVAKKAVPENVGEFLPDVEIYYKAVHDALKYDEIHNLKEIPAAKKLLQTGMERATALIDGKHPWTTQTGVVVRGYRSKIDQSVQPYFVVIPKDYDFKKKIRLDFWCHGRGETLSELNFMANASPGQFASDKAIVLNLYGRYCCANKLAGEVDCFEALAHARKDYPIDEDRLVMRGFSMGGAACWQFAVHYPSMWCAAAPGAGFAETAEFLNNFQNEQVQPTWYEKKLWHMYDCTDYALNLYNLPTVAYSGEIDKQKQAADIMAKYMKKEGLELKHIIGPKTAHSYEKGAKEEVIKSIDAIADKGRTALPEKIKFVTYTLRYNKSFWIEIVGLDRHWERAQLEAEIVGRNSFKINTKNISHFLIKLPKGTVQEGKDVELEVDGQKLNGLYNITRTGSLSAALDKNDGKWRSHPDQKSGPWTTKAVRKSPGLQGPIDDAFLDSFVMVRPTGTPLNMKTGMWQDAEMKHAITHWRQQFRGEAPQKDDKDITDDDITNSNLILWGDPSSNAILKKIADKLPITWQDGKIVVGSETFDAGTHAPILIYPNPLNPRKYVVLNSGFTFREYDYLNNARQIPKLPDFAIVDVSTPANSRSPGKVVTAGFFDEQWKLPNKK